MVLASDAKAGVQVRASRSVVGCTVPVYADHQEVRADQVDAMVVNHESKKVMTIEMSCPWISYREKKSEEKTMKYGPLRWELKEQYKGYEVHQYNIIMDVLGGWSKERESSV